MNIAFTAKILDFLHVGLVLGIARRRQPVEGDHRARGEADDRVALTHVLAGIERAPLLWSPPGEARILDPLSWLRNEENAVVVGPDAGQSLLEDFDHPLGA